MLFKDFAINFFQFLNSEKFGYSVLRNHEKLPYVNIGRDIDILLSKEDTKKIITYLAQLPGVTITGVTRRDFITVVYLHGIDQGSSKGLELDFIHKLSFKGLDYFSIADVVQRSSINNKNVRVPSLPDEALITFYTTYLLSGILKEKYTQKIKTTFVNEKDYILKLLQRHFGNKVGLKVFKLVKNNDKDGLYDTLKVCRRAFLFRAVCKQPLKSLASKLKHNYSEIKVYFNNADTLRIAFLGPDGAGKSTVIDNFVTENQGIANLITVTHLKPSFFFKAKIEERGIVTNPHEVNQRGHLTSILKLIFWVVEFRIDSIRRRRNFSLEIYDRYYHDLYIDSKRYLYGSNSIFISLFEFFIPKVDAFLVLTAPATVIQARKKEVPFLECERQVLAYQSFANARDAAFLFDTSTSPEVVGKEIENTLINIMNSKLGKKYLP